MILKAKERGDGPQLARYLMAMRDNEHVELHDLRGFIGDDLLAAFREADAIASGTRCEKHLFSISLNPPVGANVATEAFEAAISRIEEKLGLTDQPRAVIFHEKDGRRHAHVVWSRIDSQRMRAINLSHYKIKLRDVSRELYLKHGWEMPRGLQDRALRDPLTFTRQEWQQASRAGLNPKEVKAVFQQAWRASDNRAAFEQALKQRGFTLARGDRRGFVAVDYRGEVYAVARYAGLKTKEVEAKLGDPDKLRPVDEVKIEIASGITSKLQAFIKEVERDAARRAAFIAFRKAELVGRHQEERKRLAEGLERRWQAETKARAARLPRGFSGIWHRLTGQYQKIRAQNEREALEALRRDRAEKDTLVFRQLEERQALQRDIQAQRAAAQEELLRLREDVARYQSLDREEPVRERKRERDDDDGPDNAPPAPRQRRRQSYDP
ncbi:MAG: relaxase/mobilization nuclease domain-containing protein [Alphaproteobacteria bacterium]|nr:relaxase/mobilization nuclease domain-containing protein [Alphaproteobacteria bacterium]